ncbi:unnamed protein product [Paramecium pentaurelia]|uniref:Uncharacterized protein n=1 Tax=Paramecium pentaurelia TaxID=43138 RepID=A0A8S1SQB7_9CILI|nr:unnamed protein product [Paramecium pentaurelia]
MKRRYINCLILQQDFEHRFLSKQLMNYEDLLKEEELLQEICRSKFGRVREDYGREDI